MRNIILAIGLLLLAVAGVVVYMMNQGPDLSAYMYLKEPRITEKAADKMLIVEAIGDPVEVASEAFGLLYSVYFAMDGTPKGFQTDPPRARWPKPFDTPREEWVGIYAARIPATVDHLPDYDPVEGMSVRIETWKYGAVAEILHIGSYDSEAPTVERLKRYVTEQGYVVSGVHEEEYLKGPGMFLQGDPDDYVTIIRYAVMQAAADSSSG